MLEWCLPISTTRPLCRRSVRCRVVFELTRNNEGAVGCRIEFKFVDYGAQRDDDFPDIVVFCKIRGPDFYVDGTFW